MLFNLFILAGKHYNIIFCKIDNVINFKRNCAAELKIGAGDEKMEKGWIVKTYKLFEKILTS